jgi:tetratricopeptide (TPR) repeat protein
MATQDMFCRGRSQEAIDEAQSALQEAPDFAPLLMLVMFSHWNQGHRRESDSVLRLIEPLMEQLSTDERLLMEHHHGNLYGDRAEVTRAVEQLYRIQPRSYGYHAGLNALRTNRLADALDRLLATDLDSPCYSRWVASWTVTAQVYHLLGRHEEQLDVARLGLGRFPNHFRILDQELAALAALGRLAAVDSLLEVIAGLPVQEGYGLELRPVWVALELKAHGHREAYEAAMDRALAWFAKRPSSSLGDNVPYDRARAFYYAERWSDADTLFAALIAESPDNVDYRGPRGVALAHLGRREEALETERWLAQLDRPFLLGDNTRWRAAIAAALGDRDGAVRLLQQAIAEGVTHGTWQHRDPEWETLREYRPYQELMRPR